MLALGIDSCSVILQTATTQSDKQKDTHMTKRKNSEVQAPAIVEIEQVAISALDSFIASINTAIDARQAFETERCTMTESNLADLKSTRDTFTNAMNAQVMLDCNYDATRICSHKRDDSMRNIYAICRKDTNTVRTLTKAQKLNHFTRSILLSAHNLTQANNSLSFADASLACDASYKAKNDVERLFVKSNNSTLSTILTQKSSSIDSLLAFNILTETRDANNARRFTVNYSNAKAQELIELCA